MNKQLKNEAWQLWKISTTEEFVGGELTADESGAKLKNDKYEITSTVTHRGNGVYLRKDVLKNVMPSSAFSFRKVLRSPGCEAS